MNQQLYYGHHSIDGKRYENQIIKLREDTALSERNRQLILQFAENCLSKQHRPKPIKHKRVLKYMTSLKIMSKELNKDFDKATKEDLKPLVNWIDTRQDMGEWWKHDYKVCLKKFYKTMYANEDDIAFVPEQVRFIRTTADDKPIADPTSIPKPDDVNKMIQAATNTRDKALIRVLFETGMRIGELLKMQIKDIDLSEGFVYCKGSKTKWSNRTIPIRESIPLLALWLENHPYKNDKEALVWVSNQPRYVFENDERRKIYTPVGYNTIRDMLLDVAKHAGVDKKVNPHNFRKASATEDGKYMSYTNLCVIKGWKIGSDQAATYVRPTKEDLRSAKDNGTEEPKIKTNQPQQCVCGLVCDPAAKFCLKCGHNLNKQDALEKAEKEKKLLELLMRPEVFEILRKAVDKDVI